MNILTIGLTAIGAIAGYIVAKDLEDNPEILKDLKKQAAKEIKKELFNVHGIDNQGKGRKRS